MNQEYISLTWWDIGYAVLLMLIPMVVSWQARLGIARDILLGSVRTFIQLTAVGYILSYIFRVRQWYWVLIMLTIMVVIASYSGMRRQRTKLPHLFWIIAASIWLGATVSLVVLVTVILRMEVWYEPQYLIPIAGMMIASAMNAAALAVDRLISETGNRRWQVEAALALGARPWHAVQPALREAARSAMMPTINALMIVGIVQLPGMMTGQILGGVEPTQSVRYQIVIMYMLTATVTLSCMATLFFSYRQLFNAHHQLNLDVVLTK